MALLQARRAPLVPSVGGVSTLTIVDMFATNHDDSTIDIPAGAAAGDFAVILDFVSNGCCQSAPELTAPSGWDLDVKTEGDSGPTSIAVYSKILESGDVSSTVTTPNGSNDDQVGMIIFRPDVAITTALVKEPQVELTDGNPASLTWNQDLYDTPQVGAFAHAEWNSYASWASTAGFDDSEEGNRSPGSLGLGYTINNSGSPSTISLDETDQGTENSVMGALYVFT